MATYESRRYNTPVTDVTKIADGSVNNTEFETLDGVTSDIQTQLNASLPLAGGTMTGSVTSNDNVRARFGSSNDLQIYHDGSNSIINNSVGALIVNADTLQLKNSANNATLATFTQGGSSNLRFNGLSKLETTSTGVSVTGEFGATGNITASANVNGNGQNLTNLNASNLATGTVPAARLPGGLGKVLQVVSTFNNTFYSSSSTSYTDITNMNVTITPTASSSSILITFALGLVDDASGSNGGYSFRMLQGSTAIAQGTGGSVNQGTGFIGQETNNADTVMFQFYDSPGTTNALTYKLQFKNTYNGNIRINRTQDGQNSGASSITAMEIGT